MSTSDRPSAPRYQSLRDYLRVVRQRRVLIVLSALLFAGVGLGLALRQSPTYRAEASASIQDQTQTSALLGAPIYPTQTESERAQINAESIKRTRVLQEVKTLLGSNQSLGALAAPVSAFVETSTSLVTIEADSSNALYSTNLANAFVRALKIVTRDESRAQFAAIANQLRSQFASNRAGFDPVNRSLYADRVSRARFIAETSDPVQITKFATVPSTPVSPRPVRDGILGLILGLSVGVIAAFMRDALDRRLRDSEDISTELGWPILGHIRDGAFRHTKMLPTNSGDDADREAFRILRQNLQFLNLDDPPRSLAVTSALPEEGKSTVAASLAWTCAIGGKRTLLVECDLRKPSLATRLGLAPGPGLTEYLLGESEPKDILQTIAVTPKEAANGGPPEHSTQIEQSPLLVCITAGRPTPVTADLLSSGRFKDFVSSITSAYDMVVFDTSPLLAVADTLELFPIVDAVLLCVRASRTTRQEAAAVKRAIELMPRRPIGIVVTGLRPGSEEDFGYYSYSYAPAQTA